MATSKFCELSSLVLVDILAALPMEHVLRLARLDHERLRHTCSLKWVTDRMTGVSFETIVRANQEGGDVAASLVTDNTMRKLNGAVIMSKFGSHNEISMNTFVDLIKKVPGKLHLCLNIDVDHDLEASDRCDNFMYDMIRLTNLHYVSVTIKSGWLAPFMMEEATEMVFDYQFDYFHRLHHVYYRPALLNSRHIVDVIRAVCGPADVIEAELDRVRREATEEARKAVDSDEMDEYIFEISEDIWETTWKSNAVTLGM